MAEQLDMLTLSVGASPVRTSAPRASVPDSLALDLGCGSRCSESCERCGPFGLLLKTSLRYELEALTGSSLTWRRAATPAGRSWWVLMTSEENTAANVSGSSPDESTTETEVDYENSSDDSEEWQTPSASLGEAGHRSRSGARSGELLLAGQAMAEWPTPRASPAENRQTRVSPSQMRGEHGMNLAAAANLDWQKRPGETDEEYWARQPPPPKDGPTWPTPLAADSDRTSATFAGGNQTLRGATREWPTPTSTLGSNGARSTPRDATNGPNLHEAVAANWPTPRAEDCEQTGAHRGVPDTLTSAARLWPTATAGDARSSGSRNAEGSGANPGISLTDAAVHGMTIQDKANRQWATPTARDWKDTPGQASCSEDHDYCDLLPRQIFAGLQDPANPSTNGKPLEPSRMLNADWVFQLMGYPRAWARLSTAPASKRPETRLFPTSPTSSGAPSNE